MDSLKGLMDGKRFKKPDEIAAIKAYIQDKYSSTSEVMVRDKDILIIVKSAALAGTLRMESPQIQKLCKTDKKLIFRIVG